MQGYNSPADQIIEVTHQLTWDGEVDLGKVQLA